MFFPPTRVQSLRETRQLFPSTPAIVDPSWTVFQYAVISYFHPIWTTPLASLVSFANYQLLWRCSETQVYPSSGKFSSSRSATSGPLWHTEKPLDSISAPWMFQMGRATVSRSVPYHRFVSLQRAYASLRGVP